MKKIVVTIAMVMVVYLAFAIPSQALSQELFYHYVEDNNSVSLSGGATGSEPGGAQYWRNQIDENRWQGENRPEPLMGDANIDGKVDARDALMALHFAVNGSDLTSIAISGIKTPPYMSWESQLTVAYYAGNLDELVQSQEVWFAYCFYNSSFFADITKDCIINAKDALEILKYAVGKAEDFPTGDFTTINSRFMYWVWPTDYFPGIYDDLQVGITDEEFCEKYNFDWDVTPTDQ